MHDEQVRRGRRSLRIRFAEMEFEPERRELRIQIAHDLRDGAIAALPLAQLIAAVGARESHGSFLDGRHHQDLAGRRRFWRLRIAADARQFLGELFLLTGLARIFFGALRLVVIGFSQRIDLQPPRAASVHGTLPRSRDFSRARKC